MSASNTPAFVSDDDLNTFGIYVERDGEAPYIKLTTQEFDRIVNTRKALLEEIEELGDDFCECDDTHEQNGTCCRPCALSALAARVRKGEW